MSLADGGSFILQIILPFGFFESYENLVFADEQGPLDQHAVCGKKGVLLIFTHVCQFVLESQFSILETARIEEAFERQTAFFVPFTKFRFRRVIPLDVTNRYGHIIGCQPFSAFLQVEQRE